MTIAELRAIVNNCELGGESQVLVTVTTNDAKASVEIKSFRTYSDALVFNVEFL